MRFLAPTVYRLRLFHKPSLIIVKIHIFRNDCGFLMTDETTSLIHGITCRNRETPMKWQVLDNSYDWTVWNRGSKCKIFDLLLGGTFLPNCLKCYFLDFKYFPSLWAMFKLKIFFLFLIDRQIMDNQE